MWNDDTSGQARGRHDGHAPKQLEHLKLLSGGLLIIDQFMLGNTQFLSLLPPSNGKDSSEWVRENMEALKAAAHRYGGALIEVEAGDWSVLRDPGEALFICARADESDPELALTREEVLESRGNASPGTRVFIDTRCVVFVDASILFNREFLNEYQQLRESRQDKVARDSLRTQGAAVRYGFNREGDELGVFLKQPKACIALWPDIIETSLESSDAKL